MSLLLSAAARTDPRLRRTGTGYRVDTATPPDPDDQVAALPVLAIADRYGHSTRTGLWCVIDSA
ncbi:hypothetical protein [Kitasatospora sp. NPDC050543]|uniref:hypothetical protein n=1 Tax=Kitasatospora sp. NPDC050543 TaxID=3364054 RepID=UPI0037AE30CD